MEEKMPVKIRSIKSIQIETPTIRTLRFDAIKSATPGQFVMVWIPGLDEVPMSLSYLGDQMGITVACIGEATRRLHDLTAGEKVGVRGPYGQGYRLSDSKKVMMLGGGCGSASLGPIMDMATQFNQVTYVASARTKSELLFVDRALEQGIEVVIYTDDGSAGRQGFPTQFLGELLSSGDYDLVVSCGPEAMLKKAVVICNENNTPIQVALERYMRCGIGICDSCSMDGLRVCRDGPVLSGETLIGLSEFGKTSRSQTGMRIPI
jgi:dihydroorotate dehydrogenase electron transfer subunit